MPAQTLYLHTVTAALVSSDASIETMISRTSSKGNDPPSAKELHALHDMIRDTVNRSVSKRGEVCDRSMRQLVQRRKERLQIEREQEAAREEAARIKKEDEEREQKKVKTLSKKRSPDEMEIDGEDGQGKDRAEIDLPTVGAHALAPQNGEGVHEGEFLSYVSARDKQKNIKCAASSFIRDSVT